MARREWAEREVEKLCKKHQYFSEPAIALAFKTEHARTVRIVKRLQQEAEKAGRLTEYNVLADVLAALKKGRA